MSYYGKVVYLLRNGFTIAKYDISYKDDDTCNIDLNLYHPFNRHRAILNNIHIDDVDNAVLDYMTLQAYCDTEDCNKLQAYEVVEYFKSQIDKEGK